MVILLPAELPGHLLLAGKLGLDVELVKYGQGGLECIKVHRAIATRTSQIDGLFPNVI